MNFIIDLSDSYNYNVILTVICRLLKERHYISYIIDDENITVEKTAEMLLQWVYQTHDLSSFIVFNWDSQFIFILWKFLCKFLFDCSSFITLRLIIKVNESIRTLSDIFDSSVHICRMTDLNDYQWLSLLTITSCHQSSSWFSSSWTRVFILVWASTLTSSSMKAFANACRLIKSRIYLNKWTRHWSLHMKLWSKYKNKWWIKLTSIERRSITRLNQRCFWTNKTLLQRDSSKNWMTRCSIHSRSKTLLTSSINWNYQTSCIYMMYFIQSFFILQSMILCLIRRMNSQDQ